MTHAQTALYDRTLGTDLHPDKLFRTACQVAQENSNQSVAVRLANLKSENTAGLSSGSELWAVCRGGHVVTVLLRRPTQPHSAAALRVARVITRV